jgi:hypothetical protein
MHGQKTIKVLEEILEEDGKDWKNVVRGKSYRNISGTRGLGRRYQRSNAYRHL